MKVALKAFVIFSATIMFGAALGILFGERVKDNLADVGSAALETLSPSYVAFEDGGAD